MKSVMAISAALIATMSLPTPHFYVSTQDAEIPDTVPAVGEVVNYTPDPGVVPPGSSEESIYVDEHSRRVDIGTGNSSEETRGLPCTPDTIVNYPHRSKTEGDISGHGGWNKGTCSGGKATVEGCLYQYNGKDGRGRQIWLRQACDKRKLAPGGGKYRDVVPRMKCKSAAATDWRLHVDVDVDDEWDTPEKPMKQNRVNCRV